MDKIATFETAKNDVKKFCTDRDWDQFHGAKDLAIGLITEASELLEHFRFKTDEQIRQILRSKEKQAEIRHELADTLFFLLRFAQMFEIDLSDALFEKMARNALKYPVDKSKGRNAKYDEL